MPESFKVAPDCDAIVKLGPPFKLEPKIRGNFRQGQKISISSEVTGQAGEKYNTFRKQEGGSVAPYVKISNAEGEVVTEGKMRFG